MTQLYIATVVEIIKVNDIPTLELRIRVPSIHGLSGSKGIPDDKLPIAKPVITPGSLVSKEHILAQIENTNKVVIIFEDNNLSKPIYLGVINEFSRYEIPMFDPEEHGGGGGGSSNFIGTVSAVAKNIDLEGEVGNVVIDNFTLGYISEDIPIKVIVFSNNQNQRGIFQVNNYNTWSKIGVYKKEDLYSIDKGDTYGGTIIKVVDEQSLNGFEVIKKSEIFKPIISRLEPSYEDVYKYGDTWFKEIDGETFNEPMMFRMFGSFENEDNEIDDIGYSDLIEIEMPKPYLVNDTIDDSEEVELPKPYLVNDTIDDSEEVELPKPYSVNDTIDSSPEVRLPKPYSVNDTIDSSPEVRLPKNKFGGI